MRAILDAVLITLSKRNKDRANGEPDIGRSNVYFEMMKEVLLLFVDVVFPSLCIVTIVYLYVSRKCDFAMLLAFVVGLIIGGAWELSFLFFGDAFSVHRGNYYWENPDTGQITTILLNDDPFPDWYINLAHTIEDAGIWMMGVALAWFLLGRGKRPRFTHWHWGEFAIIWAFGMAFEIIVTWVQTGSGFYFFPSKFNPAYYTTDLFSQNKEVLPYTIVPDAMWVIFPFAFYAILLWLKRRYSGQKFDRDRGFKATLRGNTKSAAG